MRKVLQRVIAIGFSAAAMMATGSCDSGFIETGFPAFSATIKGTVTVQTVPAPATLTATSVNVLVYLHARRPTPAAEGRCWSPTPAGRIALSL